MNISLSDDLRDFVESEVRDGAFTSSSEYVRHLLRLKRDENRLRSQILEGLASPPSPRSSEQVIERLRQMIHDKP